MKYNTKENILFIAGPHWNLNLNLKNQFITFVACKILAKCESHSKFKNLNDRYYTHFKTFETTIYCIKSKLLFLETGSHQLSILVELNEFCSLYIFKLAITSKQSNILFCTFCDKICCLGLVLYKKC